MSKEIRKPIVVTWKAVIGFVFVLSSLISLVAHQVTTTDSAYAGPVGCEYEIPNGTVDGLTVVFTGKVVITETGEKVCRIDTSPY